MSRSITPLPMCTAPGRCPLAHSLSSRTSTRISFSPASMRLLTSGTFVSLTRCLASWTSFKNCGACAMASSRISLGKKGNTRAVGGGRSARTTAVQGARYSCTSYRTPSRVLTYSGRGFVSGVFLRKRPHQIHHVPSHGFGQAIALAHHLSFAFGDDEKNLSVGLARERCGIVPVVHRKLHRLDDVPFAVSLWAMTHGAIVAVNLACRRKAFRRGLHWIFLVDVFLGDLVIVRGGLRILRFLLRGIRLRARHSKTCSENRGRNQPCFAHKCLLRGRAGRARGIGEIL